MLRKNNYLANTTNTTQNTYDNYGNVTQAVVNINNNTQTTTTNASYMIAGTPVPARPASTTTTTSWMGAAPVTTAHAYTYNSANLLSADVHSAGGAVLASTTYTYDGFGNNTSSTITGYNNTSKSTSTTYDNKGRFPIAATNPLSQTVSSVFHPLWGKPTSETDLAGNITLNQYDEWGRIIKTTPPFYSPITTSYNWDINSSTYWNTYIQQQGHSGLKVWYNQLGKRLKSKTNAFNGTLTSTKIYDNTGNVLNETAPYLPSETPMQTSYTYDYLNRVSTSTNFQGTSNFTYSFSNGNSAVQAVTPTGSSSKNYRCKRQSNKQHR